MNNRSGARLISLAFLFGAVFPVVVLTQDSIRVGEQDDPPVVIFYGLNDSHSRSWVQERSDGTIGVTCFERFENSVDEGILIYRSNPHVFVASSDDQDQVIDHYFRDQHSQWQSETIVHFYNEGGRFIYELSADVGPDYSFHLLVLKARSNIDSDDYWDAWIGSYLYHLTNATGVWEKELIHTYDMPYTYDHHIKVSSRQDIKVDRDGMVHVIFGEQINGNRLPDPSRLQYATNRTGIWVIETALNYDSGSRDEAGWLASLCLDNNGIPHVSCMYKKRVSTGSAVFCKLLLLKRLSSRNWHTEVVADHDDGYFASDGRTYTGALSHLVFDRNNAPHIVFSDVASAHWGEGGTNRLSVGNIRYAYREHGLWEITTIYRQPLPSGFFNATEMHGLCLIVSDENDTIHLFGQEMVIEGEHRYSTELISFSGTDVDDITESASVCDCRLYQNYPNPFYPSTTITYSFAQRSFVSLAVYDVRGSEVATLVSHTQPAGRYEVSFDGAGLSSGIYLCRLHVGGSVQTIKMLLLK